MPNLQTRTAICLLAALLAPLAVTARSNPPVTLSPQSHDVWVYTFGQGAAATVAPTFAGVFDDPDPDRFGCFFLAFDAQAALPDTDRPFRLTGFTLHLSMLNSSSFDQNNGVFYDPTYDTLETFLNPQLDTDPGRPIELYAVGYRNGFTFNTWRNAGFPVTGAGGYNAVPMDFPPGQTQGRDVINSVSQQFDTLPLAIGTTPDLIEAADGTLRVLDLARWSFDATTLTPEARDFFAAQLETGSIAFMVSSLQLAGFGGMGGEEIYPRFATLETAFPVEDASVDLHIEISPPADVNADFTVDIDDLYAWEQATGLLDVNQDGSVNAADRDALLSALRAAEINDITP